MRKSNSAGRRAAVFAAALLFAAVGPVPGADSLYGKVTAVASAEVVTLEADGSEYQIRIIGIEAPKEEPLATQAKQLVSELVLGKNARTRFDHRAPNGEMVSRLFTDDPATGIKEVGLELLKAGLARRQQDYDYKYGELSAAEGEAQQAGRGLWAATPAKASEPRCD